MHDDFCTLLVGPRARYSSCGDGVTVPGQATKFVVSCLPHLVVVVDHVIQQELCLLIDDDLARNESWRIKLLDTWQEFVEDKDSVIVATRHS